MRFRRKKLKAIRGLFVMSLFSVLLEVSASAQAAGTDPVALPPNSKCLAEAELKLQALQSAQILCANFCQYPGVPTTACNYKCSVTTSKLVFNTLYIDLPACNQKEAAK